MWFWKNRRSDSGAPTGGSGPPGEALKIAIDNDRHHARFVGFSGDGNQFFLTTPFQPSSASSAGSEYLALYTFSPSGEFLRAQIDDLGPRDTLNLQKRGELIEARLASLGNWKAQRIVVEPFSNLHDGVEFGLVLRPLEDEDDIPAVEAQPGNYMAFFEPWDSGEYDT